MTLIDQIERADAGEQRELLEAAWEAIHGPDPLNVTTERLTWLFKRDPFNKMLDAEAFESAALMLLPKGWRLAAWCQRAPWFCHLVTDDFKSITWGKGENWITDITAGREAKATAQTMALALLSAILKAQDHSDG